MTKQQSAAAGARVAAGLGRWKRAELLTLMRPAREALIPVDHRLVGKGSITLDDIAGEPMPRLRDPAWNAFCRIDRRPDGSRAPDGPLVDAVEDKLEFIASGRDVAIVSAGLRAGNLRPDVTTIPLDGVEPSHVVPATRADDSSRRVVAFHKCAEALRPVRVDWLGRATPGPRDRER